MNVTHVEIPCIIRVPTLSYFGDIKGLLVAWPQKYIENVHSKPPNISVCQFSQFPLGLLSNNGFDGDSHKKKPRPITYAIICHKFDRNIMILLSGNTPQENMLSFLLHARNIPRRKRCEVLGSKYVGSQAPLFIINVFIIHDSIFSRPFIFCNLL